MKYSAVIAASLGFFAATASAAPSSILRRDDPPHQVDASSKDPKYTCWCQTPPGGLKTPITCFMIPVGGDDSAGLLNDTTGNCVLAASATAPALPKRDEPPRHIDASSKDSTRTCWCQTPPGGLKGPITCWTMPVGGDDSAGLEEDTTGNCVLAANGN